MFYHKECQHERHQDYISLLDGSYAEYFYLAMVYRFVVDPNLSPEDPEDLELFQDLIFEGPLGRIHIFSYEELFRKFHTINPEILITTFTGYLRYLDVLSDLFVEDAFYYLLHKEDPTIINSLLKSLPLKLKMDLLSFSQKNPEVLEMCPRLKLFNLFS